MPLSFVEKKRIRKSFSILEDIVEIPNLVSLQKKSYDDFLRTENVGKENTDGELVNVFNSVFPVKDTSGRCQLEFCSYSFDVPKYTVEECRHKKLTYSIPLRGLFRLTVWDIDPVTKSRSVRDIKEQSVFLVDMPAMTDEGTFVVNGVDRVVVSQLHKSPGVFFNEEESSTSSVSNSSLCVAKIIPYRGSWIDIEFDHKDTIFVKIDRRKKVPLMSFLMSLKSAECEAIEKETGESLPKNKILGMSREEVLNYFYKVLNFHKIDNRWIAEFDPLMFEGFIVKKDFINDDTDEIIAATGTRILPRHIKKYIASGLKNIRLDFEDFIGMYFAKDIINDQTGEIYIQAGDIIDEQKLLKIKETDLQEISVLHFDDSNTGPQLLNTVLEDCESISNREDALLAIYRILRPGETATLESAESLFHSLAFSTDRYDLSAVGRAKLNERLGLDFDDTTRTLRKEDILGIIKILLDLRIGKGAVDDIDNLSNRRVRSVGELLQNQFRVGIIRMERSVKERFAGIDVDSLMPHDLINAKAISASIREFFGTSQLSQFMDQTNPLSEVTHKRRVSALGPGGLSRERAGFEVRDVHVTHYGRICPIETPEGPNIGLINSLSSYAKINKYGFIETPYRVVKDRILQDEILYLSASQEDKHVIAQSKVEISESGEILQEMIPARVKGEYGLYTKDQITLIDVSPKQMVSPAAALIPFLENDDASRALMGANMQRQAVPLIKSEAPLIGTGIEGKIAIDSGSLVKAKRFGIVDKVDGERIVVKALDPENKKECIGVDIYNLRKFQGSNMSTCINQKPIVKAYDIVKKDDVIADGPAIDLGELALGRNVLVAFMPWRGFNFEDSIIVSERIVMDDYFTSIHIESYEVMARDAKLGYEEITRDIPNVLPGKLTHLDESGIAHIGAEVGPGDILVGKVTPKSETIISPEEKLLRAIFGEKAADVKDTSLRVPSGVSGTVLDVKVFSREGTDQDERTLLIRQGEINAIHKNRDSEKKILQSIFFDRIVETLCDKEILIKKEVVIPSKEELKKLSFVELKNLKPVDLQIQEKVKNITDELDLLLMDLQKKFEDKILKIQTGDELLPGVLKVVRVCLAIKRKLQPGDKMAGRHGNKGVVSKVLSMEDMPHLEDGTPVDIILNPIGVPARMNVGQILETHLGAASRELGKKVQLALDAFKKSKEGIDYLRESVIWCYEKESDKQAIRDLSDKELLELSNNLQKGVPMATPVFDGASIEDINFQLEKAGIDISGQFDVYDGITGDRFDRKVTVGQIYILKLHHLVDDKIHARSIGPYSLVTQQPLGGKAQFGGQRFGEMEVWALEAYGAAYTLLEMLTVKSDDVTGRMKIYESIVKGDESLKVWIPESFNVLVKELKSLCFNVSFHYDQ